MNCTTFILAIWALASTYNLYWLVKNPTEQEKGNDVTLFEVLGKIVPAFMFAPLIIPMIIKFKR
jgi:hypothetical protein